MKDKNWMSSLGVLFIGLITPFLIWFIMFVLAQSHPQSFDPNPLVQELVQQPRKIERGEQPTRWAHLIGKDGVWSVHRKDGSSAPLESLLVSSSPVERLVLFLEAQGPTLAMSLHQFLKDHDLTKKVILLSASDGLLKDLRFHDPQLTMSSGQAYIIRFNALRRFSLQNLMTINMSVVWLDPKIVRSSFKDLVDYFVSHNVAVFIPETADLQGKDLEGKANILVE